MCRPSVLPICVLCWYISWTLQWSLGLADRPTLKPSEDKALQGREERLIDRVADTHAFNSNPTKPPFPEGMGCFWGAERKFWQAEGVFSTQVGYASGYTQNPTYEDVCTGETGHAEVVRVVFNPSEVTYEELLHVFWDNHDPTQGMKQYGDVGTQYRSGIYYYSAEQEKIARATMKAMQTALAYREFPDVTTEILPVPEFYYAENYHQQYLFKNPDGYCGLKGTGVTCPRGLAAQLKRNDEL